jgi:hypothetical protein
MAWTSTAPLATLATAAMRASLPRAPRPSIQPSLRSADSAAITASPSRLGSASRVRRIISPSVSLVLTITWTFVSSIFVEVGSAMRCVSRPKP